jgi:Flp pilus assembly protein CpaB
VLEISSHFFPGVEENKVKRINPGTVTVAVMAIMFGLIAVYVVKNSKKEQLPLLPPPPPPTSTQRVVVAGVNVPKGTLLGNRSIQVTYISKEKELPEGSFRYSPAVVGRYTTQTIKAGQAITEAMLMPIGEGPAPLANAIPPGHRALAIMVENASIRGILEVGSFVDVSLSVTGDDIEIGGIQTRTLIHAAKVIDLEEADRRRSSSRLGVTVAVTPADANLLVTAQETGSLRLTLVSPNEEDLAAAGDFTATKYGSIFPAKHHEVKFDPPEPPAPPAPYTVEHWIGTRRVIVELPAYTIEESRRASINNRPISIQPTSNTPAARPTNNDSTFVNPVGDDSLYAIRNK